MGKIKSTKLTFVINYYTELRNKIDIESEKKLSQIHVDFHQIINNERKNLIEKLNEIERLNLNYLKSNSSKSFDQPKDYYSPKFGFLVKHSTSHYLIIVRHYINIKENSNQENIAYQTITCCVGQENKIIDLSNSQSLTSISLELDKNLEDNDFDLVAKLIDINLIQSLVIKFLNCNGDVFKIARNSLHKFSRLSMLKLDFPKAIFFFFTKKYSII